MTTPSDQEIAQVMQQTGMARMQAIRHLQQREALRRLGFGVRQIVKIERIERWPAIV